MLRRRRSRISMRLGNVGFAPKSLPNYGMQQVTLRAITGTLALLNE